MANEFLTDPLFKVGGPRTFRMVAPLVYHSDRFGRQTVPASPSAPFDTDFASIPIIVPNWLLNPIGGGLLDPDGHSRMPAVLHDYQCRTAQSHEDRAKADKIFRESMKAKGVGRVARNIMYSAVRANTERLRIMGEWR